MWSGPRNISTAMMRAFEARGDCQVLDEPFYAWYLSHSGVTHPLHDAVIASQPTRWDAVVASLLQPIDEPLYYQKHMAHHMVGDEDYGWLGSFQHAFLIRDPARMIASYQRKRESVVATDLGLARQRALYSQVCDLAESPPPIVDAADVLANPAAMLASLCNSLGIGFTDRMLRWRPGLRSTDGVWAPHWYNVVAETTGFEAAPSATPALDRAGRRVLSECEPDYQYFFERRLTNSAQT